jgi:polygalacturonase
MVRQQTTRRDFIRLTATSAGAAVLVSAQAQDGWAQVPDILKRIRPPVFPSRDFDVTRYGAAGDGVADCTEAFGRAIEACSRAGGGRVIVPAGTFLTGAIHLKSNVNLHVSSGATLRFSRDPRKFLPLVFTRWEGSECMNYSPFLYAYEQRNIAVTGTGTIDGQADCEHWWPWKGRTDCGWKRGEPSQQKARTLLMKMADQRVPVSKRVFGEGHYLRPQFIQPYKCSNVLIEGVTIKNSPMWEIHPVLSKNVTVRGVKITSHGPNNDGCDPESCTDVLIKDCHFDTGDDCIALKSGRNEDGRRVAVPCENVVIQGCVMNDGHGAVVIGSEISGNVRNVFAEDCQMDSPNLDRILRIKTNSVRGGVVEHVYMRNIRVGQVADAAITVNFFYEEGDAGSYKPIVRDVDVRNVTCKKCKQVLSLRGYPNSPIRDIRLEDCTFEHAAASNVVENVVNLTLIRVKINGKLVSEQIKPGT